MADEEGEAALLRLPKFSVDPMSGKVDFSEGGDPTACAVFVDSLVARRTLTRHPLAAALRDLRYDQVTKWMDDNCVSAMLSTAEICKGATGIDLNDPELDENQRKNIRTTISGFIRDYDQKLRTLQKNPKKIISRPLTHGSNEKSHKIVPMHYVESPENA